MGKEKLHHRKAELKAQIEHQKEGLKSTLLEIRQEIEPAKLLEKALGSASGREASGWASFSKPLLFLTDLLIRDPRLSILVKLLGPLALRFLPNASKTSGDDKSAAPAPPETADLSPNKLKTRFYGSLRRGVSAFRRHLKKEEKPSAEKIQTIESPT